MFTMQKRMDLEKQDLRLYYYDGYSIIKKPRATRFHRFNSLNDIEKICKEFIFLKRYGSYQLVVIDYTSSPSKIISIIDPLTK